MLYSEEKNYGENLLESYVEAKNSWCDTTIALLRIASCFLHRTNLIPKTTSPIVHMGYKLDEISIASCCFE